MILELTLAALKGDKQLHTREVSRQNNYDSVGLRESDYESLG